MPVWWLFALMPGDYSLALPLASCEDHDWKGPIGGCDKTLVPPSAHMMTYNQFPPNNLTSTNFHSYGLYPGSNELKNYEYLLRKGGYGKAWNYSNVRSLGVGLRGCFDNQKENDYWVDYIRLVKVKR